MNNFCWEYFKKTGDIEACIYMLETQGSHFDEEEKREIRDIYDFEYRWNSLKINKI